ncbi:MULTISPECIES: RNA polymerase sigma factor [unclassified Nocardioides]|uniref:RNA polymerase sigma factor n=1 Tax=unclassified Nocardioides TaxID=2615069 RepID=UPI0006FACEC0|nr:MULTISPECIES: SigE family RNA polymerase sigma factor [unclassified Nocardioides]KQY56507.1 hypothetical protein ASD30_09220 [Nocardioides sp. Root140]KQZ75264.1 hypothetical protein ASD66_02530 [Nocardioides sp. Root151]KRF14343.1 hypothetical protein ASH02_08325 [Nocardioides sp. Soil796]
MDAVQQSFAGSYRRLVGQLYGVCGDLSEAEDVVSEAFVRAVSHRRTFEAAENPEAWLRTVAVNIARTRFRRRQLGEKLTRKAPSVGSGRSPDLAEDRLALVAAMGRLPQAQREALALHYLADLPVDEVARTVGAPLGTVKARLSRGRTALAALMTEATAPEGRSVQEGQSRA